MPEIKFTQRVQMHLNGGSKFSVLEYNVLADDKPTEIKRVKRTDGRPKYLITDDCFCCGDDEFDNLTARPGELKEWLLAHTTAPSESE